MPTVPRGTVGYREVYSAMSDDKGKRYPLNIRTTKGIRNRLETAASASGRSLAQEVEYRIERSFRDDRLDELDRRFDWVEHAIVDLVNQLKERR